MTILQEMEIARLNRELNELRDFPIITDFALRVGNDIMTILATMPFDQWPQVAKKALLHEEHKTPTSAQMYRARLPK